MDYFDKIDEYILNRLKGEELEVFESELTKNADLQTAVKQRSKISDAVKYLERKELKKELQAIHGKEIGASKTENKSIITILKPYLAAAAVICIGLLSWWLLSPSNTSTNDIYVSNYAPYKVLNNVRDAAQNAVVDQAWENYRAGNFEAAYLALEKLDNSEIDGQILIAKAISLNEMGLTNKAISTLAIVIENKDPFLLDLANWYIGLFYLKSDNIPQAKYFFQQLANDESADKHQAAKEILNSLR